MTIDRQVVAERVRELRATLPQDGDLLTGLQRVTEATRTVVGVDGAGLTLAHEHGQPRWVAVSDAAMELLEQVQHDFGEGPCLLAYAEDRVVAVEDLRSELVWDRLAAVVAQLRVRGVLSVPVRLARQPVGTLDVYATQPRAWTPTEVEALGAFAVVTAELVSTGVELAVRDAEVAQLRRALTSRVWIEQAKGVLVATQGVTPNEAFQQLRAWARSSRRRVADLAQEVVQEAQRERIAGLAIDDARVRAAEARAQQAEQALLAAQTGLARRTAALDRAQDDLDERERAADERNHLADDRDRIADDRDQAVDAREQAADDRDRIADERDHVADERDQAADHQG
jgi:signal transduction protein with GAF and PtsI domain